MARSLLKSWQDRRPAWSKRARWYKGSWDDIRICFEDEHGITNRFYSDTAEAQQAYDDFRAGKFTVLDLLRS